MSRAGVSADYAERVMGHKMAGVKGVYDRFEYATEKAAALGAVDYMQKPIDFDNLVAKIECYC